ncbi:hypothetical protein FJT64_014812 [Amphibalanus amphitrite]|uniref:Uncharacterized protein n=1 Tax=Amphibalanus amphitrite TaxID=1232801 RepID=A0A6A4VAP1_AMPAM|nr:hypothetical protein FJT64_014812 [Amphibalanus amphitrite]
MDGSDLDSRTGAARTVADLLERDEKLPAADSSHLALEIGALHAALKRKDLMIASLQSQLLAVCQSRSSREAEREARQRERALLLERSAHLQQQIDRRRAHVKNARLTLEQLDTTDCLPSHADVSLLCLSVSYDPDSPCFSVTETVAEPGVLVEWASDSCGLSVGDRLGRRAGPTAAVAALQQELAQLSGRLQQKTQLNKALRAETQRSIEETAAYRAENQRLLRRVRQLETREAGDVRVSAESPPPSRVPDGASDHERSPIITPRDPHLISVTVPAEQTGVSPLSLPSSSSVVSTISVLQLFGERRLQNAAASLQRPRPPQKPARLSLQRAVSLQALQHEAPPEEPRRPARPAVQTWPSMDGNLEMVRQRPRPVRVRHQVCSLPRPGRVNAMRSVPI